MNSTPPSPEAIRQPESAAGLSAAQGSAARWTREECLEGMWELYRDYCHIESERDGCSATRLPDYEDMLKQLEQHGMPAPPNHRI